MLIPPAILRRIRHHAWASADADLAHRRAGYRRDRDLPRLLPMLPGEAPLAQAALIERLKRALQRERRLGAAGHWAYDLVRHRLLAAALAAESLAVKTSAAETGPGPAAQQKTPPREGRRFKP